MSSNVNVNLTGYRPGTNVTIQRKIVDYSVQWDSDDGTHHTASGSLTFPDILASAALPNDWLQQKLTELVFEAGRIILGVDSGN